MKEFFKRKDISVRSIKTLVVIVGILLALESMASGTLVSRFLGAPAAVLVIPTSLLFILSRKIKKVIFTGGEARILDAFAFFVLTLAVVLTVFDYFSPPNTLYSFTRLHQDKLFILGIYLAVIAFCNKETEWWNRYWKKVLFLSPFFFLFLLFVSSLFPFDYFEQIVKEDRFIENSQVVVLLVGAASSFYFGLINRSRQNWLLPAFFFLSSFMLFFLAGEEISWGQRIFGLTPPSDIQALNTQGEYTIHNLHPLHDRMVYLYLVISTGGWSAYWATKSFSIFRPLSNYVPHFLLSGFFFFPSIFYAAQLPGGTFHSWAEPMELFLNIGIVLWIIFLGKNVPSFSLKSKS